MHFHFVVLIISRSRTTVHNLRVGISSIIALTNRFYSISGWAL